MVNLSRGNVFVNSISFLRALGYLEVLLAGLALLVLLGRKQLKDFSSLGCFLAVRAFSDVLLTTLHSPVVRQRLGEQAAYDTYFYTYWVSFALESVLALLIVYGIFRLAMAPLKGLQTLGMLVFKWAAGISIAVALGSAFAPHMTGTNYLVAAISQLQRTQSILTLCLLLFVTFAIRPMGLSYRSRIFGVSLGLGMMATNDLVQSAWTAFNPSMETNYNYVNGFVICAILATWTAYFALPEPKRRIIVLPTTSPFLRWNQISEALGDDPGYVAVGGIPPELFAPAELEVMRRASLKMVTPFPAPVEQRATASSAL
jgi:hypothetical protein